MPLLVLAGGFSRRMGRDKASLPWEGVPLLLRVLDRLVPIASEVWVAARPGQNLPPGDYRRIDDARPGDGPLAGLAQGLAAIDPRGGGDPTVGGVPVAVAACDYPYAEPALFRALRAAAPEAAVALALLDGRAHPLMGVWRSDVAASCARALERGARRVREVLEEVGAVEVDAAALSAIDLDRALLNVNDPSTLAGAMDRGPRAVRDPIRSPEATGEPAPRSNP
ncbi:molybdenum cofactor guanylyltransferase [soil metagenome]